MSEETKSGYPLGVHYHEKKGFALVSHSGQKNMDWEIDKNKRRQHPFLRLTLNVVENVSGDYFLKKSLKGYEYWGE